MNINANATVILCYGDSNTRGSTPTGDRYPTDVRWTGLLQKDLGDSYSIIEEGLGGRTTSLEDRIDRPGKNGQQYLLPCLNTHNPIDIVILMLGTNDLKERFNQQPEDIALNINILVNIILANAISKKEARPKVILLSPSIIDETVASTQQNYKGAEIKSKKLALLFQKVAENNNCEFINIADHVSPSKVDGIHLEEEAHSIIATTLAGKIRTLMSK